jgi:hypothetical protein
MSTFGPVAHANHLVHSAIAMNKYTILKAMIFSEEMKEADKKDYV